MIQRQREVHMPGLYFEQFEVGQRFQHPVHRTVTETDNVLFSTQTMNPAALHLDAEYCKSTPFGQPIVNSIFTLGLLIGCRCMTRRSARPWAIWEWKR